MTEFTIELLDRVLEHPSIKTLPNPKTTEIFERSRVFSVDGYEYRIEWWHNQCYLFVNNGLTTVLFNYAKISNTWPNNTKTNIQFYDNRNKTCCIIELEKWEKLPGEIK